MPRPSRIAFAVADLVSEIGALGHDVDRVPRVMIVLDGESFDQTLRALEHHFGGLRPTDVMPEDHALAKRRCAQLAGVMLVAEDA